MVIKIAFSSKPMKNFYIYFGTVDTRRSSFRGFGIILVNIQIWKFALQTFFQKWEFLCDAQFYNEPICFSLHRVFVTTCLINISKSVIFWLISKAAVEVHLIDPVMLNKNRLKGLFRPIVILYVLRFPFALAFSFFYHILLT